MELVEIVEPDVIVEKEDIGRKLEGIVAVKKVEACELRRKMRAQQA